MAKKSRELLSAEAQLNMNKKQKLENFWHYNKWFVIGGVLGVFVVGAFLSETLFATKPDYSIGYITTKYIPSEMLDSMEQAITLNADDRNGDGEVLVHLNYYYLSQSPDVDPNTLMANTTRLAGDISAYAQMIYLIDNPNVHVGFVEGLVTDNNGVPLSMDSQTPPEEYGYALSEISAFADIESIGAIEDVRVTMIDENLVKEYGNEDTIEYYASSAALYEKLRG